MLVPSKNKIKHGNCEKLKNCCSVYLSGSRRTGPRDPKSSQRLDRFSSYSNSKIVLKGTTCLHDFIKIGSTKLKLMSDKCTNTETPICSPSLWDLNSLGQLFQYSSDVKKLLLFLRSRLNYLPKPAVELSSISTSCQPEIGLLDPNPSRPAMLSYHHHQVKSDFIFKVHIHKTSSSFCPVG